MNAERSVADWLAEIADQIIRRSIQQARSTLLDWRSAAAVRSPLVHEARDRANDAIARLLETRISLLTRL